MVTLEKPILCDFCDNLAIYQAKKIFGGWVYMCKKCFIKKGLPPTINQRVEYARKSSYYNSED